MRIEGYGTWSVCVCGSVCLSVTAILPLQATRLPKSDTIFYKLKLSCFKDRERFLLTAEKSAILSASVYAMLTLHVLFYLRTV